MEKAVVTDIGKLFETLPRARAERWDVLKRFFSAWLGALTPEDRCTSESIDEAEQRVGKALPVALKEWYELAGLRTSVWSCQDQFLTPQMLRIEEGRLIFYVENQSVVQWGIPLELMDGEDPPVYVSDYQHSNEWIEESPTVSIFALAQMLLSVKFSEATLYTANGEATESVLAAILQNYTRLDFPDLHWPPFPTRFYGAGDLLIETNADNWIWISGRSVAPFQSAVELAAKLGVDFIQRSH